MSVMRAAWLVLLFVLPLFACGGPAPQADAGSDDAGMPDSGPPDSGPPFACASPTRVDAVLGDTVSVMFDTRMTETRPRDLGLACGNVESELRWAPQEVVELHVPGSGPVAVELDTVFNGDTDADFNTVLQVRETCERVPSGFFPPTCFDDAAPGEYRSRGTFTAEGGRVYYITVTGYSSPPPTQDTVDSGRVRLDITVRENAAPTVTEGWLTLPLDSALGIDDAHIRVAGHDPDGDVRGLAMNFYRGAELLDIYGDADGPASENTSVYAVLFDPAPSEPDYDEVVVVPYKQVNLAAYLRAVGATHATFRVFDSAWRTSEPFRVDIVPNPTIVVEGEACDATHACRAETTCVDGTCGTEGPVATACDAAIDLGVQPDGVPVERTGATGAGFGNFDWRPACSPDPSAAIGAEAVYSVTVPAGVTADLLLTTDLPATGSTDTILYVRRACADRGTELGCNDDRRAGDVQSELTLLNLEEGVYYVFVERFGGLAEGTIPHAIRATLRPVLGSGEPCDPEGVANRCASGDCTDPGTGPVCP